MFKKGDLVLLSEKLAAIVGTAEDEFVPEEHVALWFGEQNNPPQIWTVPAEYCILAAKPKVKH